MRRFITKRFLTAALCSSVVASTVLTGCTNAPADTDTSSAETQDETSGEETESMTETKTQDETEQPTEVPTETETEALDDGIWNNTADISWIDPEKPMVAFAFDDGPVGTMEHQSSMRILNALTAAGQHATFFYWGNSLSGTTEQEIVMAYERGFEIGNHTWSHKSLTSLTEEEAYNDIEKMRAKLEELTGQTEFLIRAPYLSTNQTVLELAGVPFVNCGIDTKDWDNATAQEIIDKIVGAHEAGTLNNQILLMHETYATTAEAVEYLVPYLVEEGYQIVSVSEMFKAHGVDMEDGKIYNNCPEQ